MTTSTPTSASASHTGEAGGGKGLKTGALGFMNDTVERGRTSSVRFSF